jgi:3-hydroxyisobutyrate dehydrogenase-like beta-hydroxyacid dehydrogenase
MKLVVNSLLGIGMQAIAEAVALGEKAGLDRNHLLGVLSETAVVAPAHVGKLEKAIQSEYSPQFPLRLMNKDFELILKLAAAVGCAGASYSIGACAGAFATVTVRAPLLFPIFVVVLLAVDMLLYADTPTGPPEGSRK